MRATSNDQPSMEGYRALAVGAAYAESHTDTDAHLYIHIYITHPHTIIDKIITGHTVI